ncbi:MAG: hypothetical protein JNM93_05390 [Bacteriovoracaceae bacterium]|nr:hypothetical protein [Bacteriovoracaceae bacterium]
MKFSILLIILLAMSCVPKVPEEGLLSEFNEEENQNQVDENEIGSENLLPQVSVGANRSITLPEKSINIQATASDADGIISSYQWSKVSGGAATIVGSQSDLLQLSNLTQGTYQFKLTVTDNAGATANAQLEIVVLPEVTIPTNNAPTISSANNITLEEEEIKNVTLIANDIDNDAIELTLSFANALGSFITFNDNGDGTAYLKIEPQIGDAGNYNLNLQASDGTLSANKNIALTITAKAQESEEETHRDLACVKVAGGCDEILSADASGVIYLKGNGQPNTKFIGKTYCIPSGTYKNMWLGSGNKSDAIIASKESPLTITNCGGQVIINSNTYSQTITLGSYSRYVRLIGNGSKQHQYGIVAWSSGSGSAHMVDVEGGASDIELAFLEIRGNSSSGDKTKLTGGVGISYKTYPKCSTNEFHADNWALEGVNIHDNYIHDTRWEAIYVGPSHYGTISSSGYTPGWDCGGGKILYESPVRGVVKVHNNIIENIGNDAIQVSAAIDGVSVKNNIVKDWGLNSDSSHSGGIQLGTGCKGIIEANLLSVTAQRKTQGLKHMGTGDTFYINNIIIGSMDGMMPLRNTDVNIGVNLPNLHFYNNTFVNTGTAVSHWNGLNKKIYMKNNLFAGYTNKEYKGNGEGTNFYSWDENLFFQNAATAKLENISALDVHLKPDSPAVNTGHNLQGFVDKDYAGELRSGSYDFGALND